MANSKVESNTGHTEPTVKTELEKELDEIKGLEDIGLLPRGSYNTALLKFREKSDD